MSEETKWISVKERLPRSPSTSLLLVLVADSTVPALAIFTGWRWKAQPLFAKWFVTKDGVTHWQECQTI